MAPSIAEKNGHVLRAFIGDVWDRGDLTSIDGYIAPTYTVYHDPGDPWHGQTLTLEGFCERVETSRAPIPDQCFDIQSLTPADDRVCITWLWSGTHLGEIGGFAATGKRLNMSGATLYYFQDSKITGHWQIADRLTIYEQLMQNANS